MNNDSLDLEQIRIGLSGAGPIPTAVLYNNGLALAEAIAAAESVLPPDPTPAVEFNSALMLMGG